MKRSGWLAAIAWSIMQGSQIATAQQATPAQPAPLNGPAGIQTSAVVYTPPGFSNTILAQGRRIYLDLSHALSAVYQRDAIVHCNRERLSASHFSKSRGQDESPF